MKKSLIFLLVPVCLLFATESGACICNDFRSLEENINLYAFIAHIKIVSKTINNDTVIQGSKTRARFGPEADLDFEIIELFKGDPLKRIKEEGVKTSCEIGIRAGEEWVLFAWYDPGTKIYSVGACSPSRRIKNSNWERGTDWDWDIHSGLLTDLKKYFGHPSSEPRYESGIYRNYYPNGNIEWEAEYADNKLHGNRKIYFANGILWEDENYKEGKKHGSQKRYTRSGQLINQFDYSEGEIIRSFFWFDTSYTFRKGRAFAQSMLRRNKNIDSSLAADPTRRQLQSEGLNDTKRQTYYSWVYDEKGGLESENVNYNSGEIRVTCRYKNSKLEFEALYTKSDDHTIEKRWDEEGTLISEKEWVKGKYTGDRMKK